MKKRHIQKVAVIGSGIMGSGIACHFANIGVEVLLLDIVPKELTSKEQAKKMWCPWYSATCTSEVRIQMRE